jgi:hypothetical protein
LTWTDPQFGTQYIIGTPGNGFSSLTWPTSGGYPVGVPTSNWIDVYPVEESGIDSYVSPYCRGAISTGPNQFYTIGGPTDSTESEQWERYLRFCNAEATWCALHVVTLSGATLNGAKIGVPALRVKKDWTNSLSQNEKMIATKSNATQIYAIIEPQGRPNNEAVTAGSGVTICKPDKGEAFKLLFDPLKLQVAF